MKKDCHALTFRVYFDNSIDKMVYLSEKAFNELPEHYDDNGDVYYGKRYDEFIDEYFTKEKVEHMKRELCDKIMSTENPFIINMVDLDSYPIEESKIYK